MWFDAIGGADRLSRQPRGHADVGTSDDLGVDAAVILQTELREHREDAELVY
jgi:hypothetical protein